MNTPLVTKNGLIALERVGPVSLTAFSRLQWDDATWREYCENAVRAMELGAGEPAAVVVMYAPARSVTTIFSTLLRMKIQMERPALYRQALIKLHERLADTAPFEVGQAIAALERCMRAVGDDPKGLRKQD